MEKLNKQNWAIKFRDWLLKRGSFPDDGGGGGKVVGKASYAGGSGVQTSLLSLIREATGIPDYEYEAGDELWITYGDGPGIIMTLPGFTIPSGSPRFIIKMFSPFSCLFMWMTIQPPPTMEEVPHFVSPQIEDLTLASVSGGAGGISGNLYITLAR